MFRSLARRNSIVFDGKFDWSAMDLDPSSSSELEKSMNDTKRGQGSRAHHQEAAGGGGGVRVSSPANGTKREHKAKSRRRSSTHTPDGAPHDSATAGDSSIAAEVGGSRLSYMKTRTGSQEYHDGGERESSKDGLRDEAIRPSISKQDLLQSMPIGSDKRIRWADKEAKHLLSRLVAGGMLPELDATGGWV